MRQRAAGVLILALALLGVLVVSALNGRGLPGTAVSQPIPPPAQVGDCVLEDLYPALHFGDEEPTAPPARLGPCSGKRFGEVVRVSATTPVDDFECYGDAAAYLGLAPVEYTDTEEWWSAISVFALVVRPSELQSAVGQHWSACVMLAPSSDGSAAVPLPSSPKDARHTADGIIARFGSCNDGLDPPTPLVCSSPHTAEVFAYRTPQDPTVTQREVDDGCRAQVVAATGMADPTGGGVLVVEAVTYTYGADGTMTRVPISEAVGADGFTSCAVRVGDPERRLTAGLTGLGDRPIPMT